MTALLRHASAALAAATLLTGCSLLSGPSVVPTQFYVLNATAAAGAAAPGVTIGLGPVTLPAYLDRPPMAVRVDHNQVAYREDARWAEPLRQNFIRALAANLQQLTGADRIELYPWYNTAQFDFIITVAVVRFEQQRDQEAQLIARWTLRDGRGGAQLAARETNLRRVADTPEQTAAALSELTAALAEEIASALGAARR